MIFQLKIPLGFFYSVFYPAVQLQEKKLYLVAKSGYFCSGYNCEK
jgi:hypothetical protein